MRWIDASTHNMQIFLLVTEKRSIVGRVQEAETQPGWWGGLFNKAGAYTNLIPKPYDSKEIAKQMVEEAYSNSKEIRG